MCCAFERGSVQYAWFVFIYTCELILVLTTSSPEFLKSGVQKSWCSYSECSGFLLQERLLIWLSAFLSVRNLSWTTWWWQGPRCRPAIGSSIGPGKLISSTWLSFKRVNSRCWCEKKRLSLSLWGADVHPLITALSGAWPRPWMAIQVTGWQSKAVAGMPEQF